MTVDTKQAEKDYLRRTADVSWDRDKPFSPPGAHTLDQSARLIHDFAIAIRTMTPGPGDLVLDLGAGACWCSDWLRRLNINTVAVDISSDMLALGKTRLPAGRTGGLVAGDMERLPFASGTFDMAFCLNAIHHAPDMPAALGEISRVLAPHGAVFFSEPGAGHSAMSESVAAMRDFGVLDQDILVAPFVAQCRDAGFVDVRIQALSYSLPQCTLTVEQWQAWDRVSRTPRPIRAATKMWRALLESFGLRKDTDLIEETFTMEVIRLLKASIEHHPVIVARKSK